MKIRYFDHAATTAVRNEVIKEMIPYMNMEFGNASSIYQIGRKNKKVLEECRLNIAKILNCKQDEIYFTSCGSESDNLAIKGIMYANKSKGNHLITTKIEHPAVLNCCRFLEKQGFEVTYLNVDSKGKISLTELKNAIKPQTVLISIMFANNEIGTIQPIKQIGEIAKSNNIIFHTDAVQAMGNIKIDVEDLNITALSMSAHKFYGPKGVGALYMKEGTPFVAIQNGGHQEKGKRAGTENIPGIVGMSKALELIYKDYENYNIYIKSLRDFYIQEVQKRIKDTKLNGDENDRLPGNASISFKGVDAGELLLALDAEGICTSAGSACTSGSVEPSHVLVSIGLNEDYIQGTLRATFGIDNTKEDVEFFIDKLEHIVEKLRKMQ